MSIGLEAFHGGRSAALDGLEVAGVAQGGIAFRVADGLLDLRKGSALVDIVGDEGGAEAVGAYLLLDARDLQVLLHDPPKLVPGEGFFAPPGEEPARGVSPILGVFRESLLEVLVDSNGPLLLALGPEDVVSFAVRGLELLGPDRESFRPPEAHVEVGHDDRVIPPSDGGGAVDGGKQGPRLDLGERLHLVDGPALRGPDELGVGGVDGDHPSEDHLIEEGADGGELAVYGPGTEAPGETLIPEVRHLIGLDGKDHGRGDLLQGIHLEEVHPVAEVGPLGIGREIRLPSLYSGLDDGDTALGTLDLD